MDQGRILVAFTEGGAWRLYRRLGKGANGWCSLQLDGPKKRWWLGHNGERLARNHDANLLQKREPEIFAWVNVECRREIPDPS